MAARLPPDERACRGARLAAAMKTLGWHHKDTAARFDVSSALITRCVQGDSLVPTHVLRWIEARAYLVAMLPANPRWKTNR